MKTIKIIFYGLLFITFFSCSFFTNKQEDKNNSIADILDTLENSESDVSLEKQSAGTYTTTKVGMYFVNDLVFIPTFYVKVNLSSKAEKKLSELNETIIVTFTVNLGDMDFTDPNNSILKKYPAVEADGAGVLLFEESIEIKYNELAKFENLSFDKRVYDLLKDKTLDDGYVQLCTGRRIYEKNLLWYESIDINLSEVVENQIFTIDAKLIYGDD